MPKTKKNPAVKPKKHPVPQEKRTKNHKTAKDPWEAAREDEEWEVADVRARFWKKAQKYYTVLWKPWTDKDGKQHEAEESDEPAYNLVGSAELVRAFDEAEDAAAEKKRREDKAAREAAREARLAEAAEKKRKAEEALLAASEKGLGINDGGAPDPMAIILQRGPRVHS